MEDHKEQCAAYIVRCVGCQRPLVLDEQQHQQTYGTGNLPICWVCANTRWTITNLQQGHERAGQLELK